MLLMINYLLSVFIEQIFRVIELATPGPPPPHWAGVVPVSVANSQKDLPANFAKKFRRWKKNSASS
jgi:hypothetical protein